MKTSFIWLIVLAFIVGLVFLSVNLYDDAVHTGQAIEEKVK